LQFAASQINAKSVVEIGTGSGVSGLWLFQGMTADAVLTSIDAERELSTAAREVFEEAGISPHRFRLISGVTQDIVSKLADGNYDLVVIRTAADLMDLIHEAHRLLRVGGTLVIDHALSGGKVADPTQRDFETISRRDGLRAIKDDQRWRATLLPLGAGTLLATKS
jgi:predicted O-methyltransferase YrrM